MARLTKKQKEAHAKLDNTKALDINAASALIKEITNVKFDASVDIAVRLGVDPRKANQMVRGVVTLPHGTGKDVKVLALVTPDKEAEAQEAGADYVGLDEYLQKIKGGWTDVDVIITMPSVMGKLGPLGRVLGPRGLMPNPKTGTVTMDVAKAVKEVKAGKIDFKVDKTGIIHAAVAKASFDADKIAEKILAALRMQLDLYWTRQRIIHSNEVNGGMSKSNLVAHRMRTSSLACQMIAIILRWFLKRAMYYALILLGAVTFGKSLVFSCSYSLKRH